MSSTRRNFLIGAGTGVSLLALAACVPEPPKPTGTVTPKPSPSPSGLVPQPTEFSRSSWLTDSFSRGSHSFVAVGATPQHRVDLRTPVKNRVFFAGEATSSDHPGTVLGAQLSGARAASEVLSAAEQGERIAVIGAGMAGAQAAADLHSAGFDVIVIEGRDRVGGRIDTRSSTTWPTPVELGAWRIDSGADAAYLALLARSGVTSAPVTGELLLSPGGPLPGNMAGPAAVAQARAWASGQPADSSLQVALTTSGAAASTDGTLLAEYLAELATLTGAAGADLSALYGVPAAATTDRVVSGGLSALVKSALKGVTVSLSNTVAGVSYSDSGVSLRMGTGESLKVDRVIVTVPLGVLKKRSVSFLPELPAVNRAAISALGMGVIEAVWLRFDAPFWSSTAASWNLAGTTDLVTNWFNLVPITGDPVLVGIVGADSARSVAGLSDADLLTRLRATLVPFATA